MYELVVHKDFCVCVVLLEVRIANAIHTCRAEALLYDFFVLILILQIQFVCVMECFILQIGFIVVCLVH